MSEGHHTNEHIGIENSTECWHQTNQEVVVLENKTQISSRSLSPTNQRITNRSKNLRSLNSEIIMRIRRSELHRLTTKEQTDDDEQSATRESTCLQLFCGFQDGLQ